MPDACHFPFSYRIAMLNNPLPSERHEGCHDEDDEDGHLDDHDDGLCSTHESAPEKVDRREGEHDTSCPHLGRQINEGHGVRSKPVAYNAMVMM